MGLLDRLRGGADDRVALIGIDGVPYDLIREHPSVFEHLTEIAEAGSAGPIDSIVPPESSACWPALTTGVNPGKTGVYGFQDREVGSYDTYVPMGGDVQATRVWDRVTGAGRAATVLNVPVTFPPQRDVQRMVSGFLSPDLERAVHPTSARSYLESIGYRVDVDAQLGHETDKEAFLADASETLESRARAFEHFIAEDDWDLFVGVFMTTDRVNHFLFEDYEREGRYHDEFLEFYRQVDAHVGAIHEALPEDVTLLVASDHGFTTLEYEANCNEWLREGGWLEFDTDEPAELEDIADGTRAYSFIPGRFYLNLEGREPRGSVPKADYEAERTALREALADWTGPDGRPVVDRVVDGEDVFDGPHEDIAPDLVAIPTHGYDLKSGFSGAKPVFDADGPRNGMHTFENATLVADDPDLILDDGVDLYDLAPTILEVMGLEGHAAELDGRSLVA